MRTRHSIPLALTTIVAFGGCAGMTDTQQRTVTGSAAGAAGGAVIGAIAGNAGLGALIGAGAGAGGGYLYGRSKENQERAYQLRLSGRSHHAAKHLTTDPHAVPGSGLGPAGGPAARRRSSAVRRRTADEPRRSSPLSAAIEEVRRILLLQLAEPCPRAACRASPAVARAR